MSADFEIEDENLNNFNLINNDYNPVEENLNHLLEKIGANNYEIIQNSQFSIESIKIEKIDFNFNSIFNNSVKENSELKKLNEILEREINLLKSLLLINNLNLNTSDSKTLYHDNYFVEMCNDEKLQQVINDDKLFKQQEILHIMQLKINNLKKRLDLFKKGFEEDRRTFIEFMESIHKRIMEYFNHELKIRKTIEEKVSNIKKLI